MTPSTRLPGGILRQTEADVVPLMVIRRMKPLGFILDEMGDLCEATGHLDAADLADGDERHALLVAGAGACAGSPIQVFGDHDGSISLRSRSRRSLPMEERTFLAMRGAARR